MDFENIASTFKSRHNFEDPDHLKQGIISRKIVQEKEAVPDAKLTFINVTKRERSFEKNPFDKNLIRFVLKY